MESDIAGAANVGMDSLYLHTATSSQGGGRYRPTYQVTDGDWGKAADILLGEDGGLAACTNFGKEWAEK